MCKLRAISRERSLSYKKKKQQNETFARARIESSTRLVNQFFFFYLYANLLVFSLSEQLFVQRRCCFSGGQEEAGESDDVTSLASNDPLCETTEWGEWSECSNTCGPGLRMRTRRFRDHRGRKRCPLVSLVEKEKCMEPPCPPGTEERIDPLCKVRGFFFFFFFFFHDDLQNRRRRRRFKVTDWSDWSPCSASCGKGVKLRTRLLMVEPSLQTECSSRVEMLQQRPCLVQADCTFDMATAKGKREMLRSDYFVISEE